VIYLVVGLDRHSLTPWFDNIAAGDPGSAKRTARHRARRSGVSLVVAAVIGPGGAVLPDSVGSSLNVA
jgi:hypothetical protein